MNVIISGASNFSKYIDDLVQDYSIFSALAVLHFTIDISIL